MTMDAEVWSDEDIHADVSALNDIFGGDSVSMNYVSQKTYFIFAFFYSSIGRRLVSSRSSYIRTIIQ